MLSESDCLFLTKRMNVVIEHLELELNRPCLYPYKKDMVRFIHYSIEKIKKYESLGIEKDFTVENDAQKFIGTLFATLNKRIKNDEFEKTSDALRHAFNSFACNGLVELYIYQQNEGWYPKVILTEVLEPNDIDSLDDIITLYRGCDIEEYINGEFGQAWTTSLDVAKEFANSHYRNQDWFRESSRVVLKTEYPKEHVLYSKQSGEYEVVVNTTFLAFVEKLNFDENEEGS